ncbi:MAG: M50 family metallopeptidase [Patescibacteria group bacterium]
MTVFIFILILSFLVVIHELGHFLLARKHQVKVHEFGFGYPPKVIKLFSWQGTDFTLNWIPFGGFVHLEGETVDSEEVEDKKNKAAFYNKSIKARFAVIFAGPLFNIIYALLIFSVVFSVMGIPQELGGRARIAEVVADSPAATAGIEPNYEIIGFKLFQDQISTPKVEDVINFTQMNKGQTVTVQLQGPCSQGICPENLLEKEVYIRTDAEIPAGEGAMGVAFADFYLMKKPWYIQPFIGIWYGLKEAIGVAILIVLALVNLFKEILTGSGVPEGLAGPVGIVHQASSNGLLDQGWLSVLGFSGMLSLNLGIMNILPIPALDGGRMFFLLLEKFIGRAKVKKFEGSANLTGFIILLSLIIMISIRDVWRIFQ